MAIVWGPYAGRTNERVGIDVWTDGYDTNTPSINVYVDVYVESALPITDDQVINVGGSGIGLYTEGFAMRQGTRHATRHIIYSQGQNYNGGPTYSWSAHITGHFEGVQPGVSVTWSLPPRPPNVPTMPPTAVDNVTATGARVVVSAADGRGAGINGYEAFILRNNAWPGAGGQPAASASGGTFSTNALTRATTYYYTARARNAVGWGAWTTMKAFTTKPTIPGAPTIGAVTGIGPDSATLAWSAPSDNGGSAVTAYQVQLATNAAFTTGVVTTSGSGLSRALTGLSPGTPYWVRVRAVNAVDASTWSAVRTFETLLPAFVRWEDAWRRATAWVKWEGAWRQARVYKRTTAGWTL